MEQLSFFKKKQILKTCAFTGHRVLASDFSEQALKKELVGLIEAGVKNFYCGMAMGFDLAAAEAVLELKAQYPDIQLIACIPCPDQDKHFSQKDKDRYASILEKADTKTLLSERYHRGCMHTRNRYMADRADALIAYCKRDEGGTAYTVQYFKQKRPRGKLILL